MNLPSFRSGPEEVSWLLFLKVSCDSQEVALRGDVQQQSFTPVRRHYDVACCVPATEDSRQRAGAVDINRVGARERFCSGPYYPDMAS